MEGIYIKSSPRFALEYFQSCGTTSEGITRRSDSNTDIGNPGAASCSFSATAVGRGERVRDLFRDEMRQT